MVGDKEIIDKISLEENGYNKINQTRKSRILLFISNSMCHLLWKLLQFKIYFNIKFQHTGIQQIKYLQKSKCMMLRLNSHVILHSDNISLRF